MSNARVLPRAEFDALLDAVGDRGYTVIGPTVGDDAIVYGRVRRVEDLPIGWTAEQEAGTYRLRRRADDAMFGYAVGPDSWKKYVYAPEVTLLEIRRVDGSLAFDVPDPPPERYAFLGVRACELAALDVQDRVFLGAGHEDRHYQAARAAAMTIAVNCTAPGGTCFCASVGTGPECRSGYDLLLTEVLGVSSHEFVVEAGSDLGEEILTVLPGRPAGEEDLARVRSLMSEAAGSMGRTLETDGLRELLQAAPEHPRWAAVAQRCLACANCTMVCPTCFCSTVVDSVGLEGGPARRVRRWDSCFALDFSTLHQVPVRSSIRSRYRQWMTHKLSTWHDQFGVSGCVGCGRCITWCPVGIDITEEAAAMRPEVEVGT